MESIRVTIGRWAYVVAGALEARDRYAFASDIADRSAFGLRALRYGFGRSAHAGTAARRHVAAETIVGADLYHSDADRKRALAQLTDGFAKLSADLDAQAPAAPWLALDVRPTLDEWAKFREAEAASWTARFVTDWREYEEWYERLKRLRELARVHGITLASAEPTPLPETVWEQGSSGRGGTISVWVSLVKVIVIAAIGITGFVALYAVIRDIRGRSVRGLHHP